jgi:arginyl-tRNA synthetase
MAQYPDVTHNAFKTLEPTTILTYLFKFNHQVSSGYEVIRAIDIPEGQEVSRARVAYYECARQVLNNGLRLLGITPVDRCV